MSGPIPPGYEKSDPKARAELAAATAAAMRALKLTVKAAAFVFVMPDGKVMASLGANDIDGLARLAAAGPETLRAIIDRYIRGEAEAEPTSL